MKPSPELAARMRAFYQAFVDGDTDSVLDLWSRSQSTVAIGSDPDEWSEGFSRIVGTLRAQIPLLRTKRFESKRLQAFAEGSIGWAFDDVVFRFGERDTRFRITAVFRRELQTWRLMHMHVSEGVKERDEIPIAVDEILEAVLEEHPSIHPALGADGRVTILFSDIEHSTSIANELGDLQWMEVLRSHNRTVRDAVAQHDGYEVKSQGDGFMIAFPTPKLAIGCALEIQRAMADLDAGMPLRVRIGVHAGPAVFEDDDFFGRTVIAAARICSVADGGEILISDDVRSSLVEDVTLSGPRSVILKGFEGSWEVWSVG